MRVTIYVGSDLVLSPHANNIFRVLELRERHSAYDLCCGQMCVKLVVLNWCHRMQWLFDMYCDADEAPDPRHQNQYERSFLA